jgi:serine/threonine protein kinase
MTDKRDEAIELIGALTSAVEARYTLRDIIGYGRGGITVRARDVSGRMVAIKIAWKDEKSRALVLRESELTAKVDHPSVLTPRRIDVPEPMLAVETALMASSLGDTLDAQMPMAFDKVCEVLTVIGAALDKAHSIRVVHGGILPEKIFVDENGKYFIGDFSLRLPQAVFVDGNRPSVVGFTAYTPPEQRHDTTNADGRIDQFALAVVAYELLRGMRRWRFGEEGVLEVDPIAMVGSRPSAPGAPATASAAIRRGTARDPAYRYATVGEFVRAFAGLTKSVTPAEHIFHEQATVEKRHAWLWLLPVAACVAGLAALQPTVRDSATRLWRADWTSPEFWHPNVEAPRRSTTQVGTGPATPVPGTTRRGNVGGSTRNTRDGASTSGSGNTTAQGSGSPDRTFDPFPRLPPPSNTRVGEASPRVQGAPQGSSSPGSGGTTTTTSSDSAAGVSGSKSGPSRSNSASETLTTGLLEVSIRGAGAADVMIDGTNRGRTPLTWTGPAGKHVVTMRPATAFKPAVMEVTVVAGTTVRAVFTPR